MEETAEQPLITTHNIRVNRPELSESNQSNSASFKCNLTESPLPQQRYTINTAIETIGSGAYQTRILMVTGSLWACNAAEIVLLSFLLPILKNKWTLKQNINSIIGAAVFIGMFAGSILWRNIGDKYGRVRVIRLCIIGYIIFGICCSASANIYWMITFKFCHGFCLGGTTVALKLYWECCPEHGRSNLFCRQLCFWVIGSVANTLIAWSVLATLDWRWYLIISSVPMCIVLIFSLLFVSESPKWLLMKKDVDEAKIALLKAARLNHKQLPRGSLKKSSSAFNFGADDNSINTLYWKQMLSMKYYVMSITLYVIVFCCIFEYFGIVLLSKRFFDDDWKMFITSCSEILCLFVATKIDTKPALMLSFVMFTLCMFVLMLQIDLDIVILLIALVFIGRMFIFFSFLKLYIFINEYYDNILRDNMIQLAYVIGIVAAMISVFVSQSNDIQWICYIYGVSGVASFIAACMLKIGRIHYRSGLMKSVDYKTIERRSICERIEENKIETS